MIWIKRIFSQMHRYVLWLLISAVFWGWIFTIITDTIAAKKVVLYADVPYIADRELAIELEKDLPEGIRMVQVHPFSYALFNTLDTDSSDLYILPEQEVADTIGALCPIPQEEAGKDAFVSDGVAYGWLIYSADTKKGSASSFLTYHTDQETDQDFYICFRSSSRHLGEWNGSNDDAAVILAKRILSMQ